MGSAAGGRGQTPLIGFVLLAAIVAIGVGAVVLVGGTGLADLERSASADRAVQAMSQLDSQASVVALGESNAKRVRLPRDGSATVDESAGTITVEQVGCGTCPVTLASTTLGAVRYEAGGTTVAYQGGGVWRQDPTGYARMVSPPEFHYRYATGPDGDPTLTFPLVVVRGDASGADLQLSKGPSTAVFPDADAGLTNPLGSGSIRVTIQSDYYRGWAEYFETRTDADSVDVDADARTVEVLLTVPDKSREVEEAIASRDPTLNVQGGATVDSYDSSVGTYAATRGSAGSVYVGNDLTSAGNGIVYGDMRVDGDFGGGGGIEVRGDLLADGDVTLGGGVTVDGAVVADGDFRISGGGTVDSPVTITGNFIETGGGVTVDAPVRAGGNYDSKSGGAIRAPVHVGGDFFAANGQDVEADVTTGGAFDDDGVWPNVDPGVTVTEGAAPPDLSATEAAKTLSPPDLTPIDGAVSSRIASYQSANDNAGTDAARIEAGDCGSGSPACTLTAGTYHLDSLELDGNDRLTFDTTGGPVHVAVDGDVATTGGSAVEVVGPNRVHLYYAGDLTVRTDWESVGDRGDQIWTYGTSASTVTVQGGADFYGVVYAPGNQDVTVRGNGEVFGAVVGSVSTVQGGSAVHYDEVLTDQEPEFVGGGTAPVTFLHVSVNEVRVTSD